MLVRRSLQVRSLSRRQTFQTGIKSLSFGSKYGTGTNSFKSESWNDSLGSKDKGSSSIKRKNFLLSASMSLSSLSGSRLQDDENDDNNHDDLIDELEMTTTEEKPTSMSCGNGKRSLPQPIYISLEDLSFNVPSSFEDDCTSLDPPSEILKLSSADMQTARNSNEQFVSVSQLYNNFKANNKGVLDISFRDLQQFTDDIVEKRKYVTEADNAYVVLLCNALAKKSEKRSAELVEKLSTFLEEEFQCYESSPKDFYKEFGYVPYKPDVMMYTLLIDAWARVNTGNYRREKTMEIIERMLNGKAHARPNAYTFTTVFNALRTSAIRKRHNNLEISMSVMKLYEELIEESHSWAKRNDDKYALSEILISSIIRAFAFSMHNDRINIAEKLYDEYFVKGSFDESKFLLKSMIECYFHWNEKTGVDYLLVALKSREMFNRYRRKYEISGNPLDAPNEYLLLLVTRIWCKVGSILSRQEITADKIIFKKHGVPTNLADLALFSANFCESLLRDSELLYEKHGSNRFKPSIGAYNNVIKAWEDYSCNVAGERDNKCLAAQRAEYIFDSMRKVHSSIDPLDHTYVSVINAWGRSGGVTGAQKAEVFLQNYEKDMPNGQTTPQAYNAVLASWAHTKSEIGMERSLSLLNRMEILKICNSNTYKAVLSAIRWSGDPEAPKIANEFIRRIEKAGYLDVGILYSVMLSWLDIGGHSAEHEIKKLYDEAVEKFSEKENTKLDDCCRLYLKSILLNGSNHRVIETIRNQCTANSTGSSTYLPSEKVFLQLFKHDFDVKMAQEVIEEMKALATIGIPRMYPTILTFENVLLLCQRVARANAMPGDHSEDDALQLAIKTYAEALKDISPKHFHFFDLFVDTCYIICPHNKERMIQIYQLVFEHSCSKGLMNKTFFDKMKNRLSCDELRLVMGSDFVSQSKENFIFTRLPSKWSKNLPHNMPFAD